MIDSIKIGSLYKLKLIDVFGGMCYNVSVIGKTFIDSVEKNEKGFNVYNTFFQPIGFGLNTYYEIIRKDTPILICNIVSNLDPLKIEESKFFIPESLIDKRESDLIVDIYRIGFTIEHILKRNKEGFDINVFIEEMKAAILEKFRVIIDLSDTNLSVSAKKEKFYVEKTFIDLKESENAKLYDDYYKRRLEELKSRSDNEYRVAVIIKRYEDKLKKLDALKEEYETRLKYLNNIIEEVENPSS